VTRDNVEDLQAIYRLAEEEGIGRLCIYHLVYSGRGSYIANIDLDTDETRVMMNGLLTQVDRWNKSGSEIEVLTVDNHADGPYTHLWLKEQNDPRAQQALDLLKMNGGNRSGVAIGCIDSFGFVHIDQFTPTHIVGSIRQRPFSQIWTDPNNELLAALRDRKPLLQGKCSSCRWLSCCNGNFRTRAEAATGDLWQPDPACYLRAEEIAQVEEVAYA
jgi:radical SAM protein with 4Fe4S-binding SPASM domain